MTDDVPMTPEECAEPDVDALPMDQPVGQMEFPHDSHTLMADYMAFMKDTGRMMGIIRSSLPVRVQGRIDA